MAREIMGVYHHFREKVATMLQALYREAFEDFDGRSTHRSGPMRDLT
jgi:hypothetical protein